MSVEHELPRITGPWGVWPWAVVRGAGLPADRVLPLGAPGCARLADEVLAAERALGVECDTARAELGRRAEGGAPGARHRTWQIRRLLDRGRFGDDRVRRELGARADALAVAVATLDAARAQLRAALAAELPRIASYLAAAAREPLFAEAVIWQNRKAAGEMLRGADGGAARQSARTRQHAIASYLQRYCVKNDTIGFFGPAGWARIDAAAGRTTVRPGDRLLARREVFFEDWAVAALAERLSRDHELRPFMAPRRVATVDVDLETSRLLSSFQPPVELARAEARVLAACDGQRTACDLAACVDDGLDPPAIFEILERLRARGAITWAFEVGGDPHAERSLRRQLERITEPALRRRALAPLDQLEAARAQAAAAAGDPERLDRALTALEVTFRELTGRDSSRLPGRTYAARTLVYEECGRDLEMTIGGDVLGELAPPLELLLLSARWFSYRAARAFRTAFRTAHDALAAAGREVDGFRFAMAIQPLVFADRSRPHPVIGELSNELVQRWGDLFGSLGDEPVQLRSAALRDRALELFAAPHAGWAGARHLCPDIMIAGGELGAGGDAVLVLAEFHPFVHTFLGAWAMAHHPDPAGAAARLSADLPGARAVPIPPRPGLLGNIVFPQRVAPGVTTPSTRRIEILPAWYDGPDRMGAAEFVVEPERDSLAVRTRDGRLRFDVIDFFSHLVATPCTDAFRLLVPGARHTPRITIDRLVVSRETWRVSAAELAGLDTADEAERLLAARRTAAALRLPRFVFARVPHEDKPIYVDWTSPPLLRLLARQIKGTPVERSTE
ncbi:MAG TPA: lantibiotic dehydratase, partial [Kofleriaceae bacterium]|nr:lantibiotic dehydratase [Kofleriaceae bacterium]